MNKTESKQEPRNWTSFERDRFLILPETWDLVSEMCTLEAFSKR